ncbi:tRNA delta(2)-isopentenylpyrophosphate transferase [Marinitoga sp. 1135]|uniref:tRNA dimethylallyltransferase n=1 Tax=Marinitoga piezophila (strain DSM 14283 / JCM 11233 / KA3) TaxID=443254 RepID=H2J811_MARPK|nr:MULTISPECIES: tRNA (adenosine(37)-N6)-dimethylallyltransferase MiaA [Marinitoga]AEX85502.1 tRNA isopentenyltransferase MiaA [Marinitoga piezophila KA3]APT75971.1 tRNA delta(2)-isopentenylpyrophosphate transferase [Marinitoga sp. 1137]NUU95711.1 tRNA delta(2)-isopentenylpyrophosphate transferase [Marinitoga sp. 1135]NUU97643.1 tRNA delta(2)-isopentenylpyrophosphate transferase [Marinitoga sp. 1138]
MKLTAILGPTAVGKTNILTNLGEKFEVISCDSRQIYKYMNIGTAKPTPEEREKIPHHLIDFVSPDEHYNAYMYRVDALKKIKEVLNKGKIPIISGGTGLYFDAVSRGFFEAPSSLSLRSYLKKLEYSQHGIIREILKDVDPESYVRIHPNDLKRSIRALEIYILSGKRMSDLIKSQKTENPYEFQIIILDRDRKELHERINTRVEKMIEMGLIDEVKNLLRMGYNKNLNSMNTIGYKEVLEYIEGKVDYDKMIHLIKRNTRRYARRQIIYFRGYKNAIWINLSEEKNPVEKIKKIIKNGFNE